MLRIDCIRSLSPLVEPNDLFVSSAGGLRADWWNHKPGGPEGVYNSFWPAALGSISTVALGLAIALPHRRVIALETDGSVLMNTGALCTLGNELPTNMTVIVFDNEMYESIGRHPTLTARRTSIAKMAAGAGCSNSVECDDIDSFSSTCQRLVTDDEFGYLVAKIEPGVQPWRFEERKPTDGVEDKYRFLRHIEQSEGIVIHSADVMDRKSP